MKGISKLTSVNQITQLLSKDTQGGFLFNNGQSLNNCFIFPGFCDVHVHFREPGFFYKESILTGSKSAVSGGYTACCTMPNLNPVPDSLQNLSVQLDIINRDALCHVIPFGAITKGQNGLELADLEDMSCLVAGFSDDGRGVQSEEMMLSAMLLAKKLDKIIVAHCEDNSLLNGGYIHDGEYARQHNHKGISSASEYKQIERDINLVRQTGVKYHVCHISTKESVQLIRQAKQEGLDITCETAPHYLVLNDSLLVDDGRFKMNPPIRSEEDRQALLQGIVDGTIDMIATDHAPHSQEEKSKSLKLSLNGIVGLETAFPILYTHLCKTNIISLERLIELFSYAPAKRFNLPTEGNYCVWDLSCEYNIDSTKFNSKGKSTPFEGSKVFGKCLLTIKQNKIVYSAE